MLNFRLIKRERDSWQARIAIPLLSIILALLFGGLFLSASGHPPVDTYLNMLERSLGSNYALTETIVKAIPLMLTGLAISLAFRMKLWNIGAEGQIYMGAFAASGVALFMGDLPSYIMLLLMFLAAFISGGVWGLVPGILKAYWKVNETITTLMLNYVAIYWVDYLVYGPWKDPKSMGFPLSARFAESAYLPTLGNTRLHLGLLIAFLLAVILYFVLKYSRWGYEIKVMGESEPAARYAGINVKKNIMLVMLISAGLAGIAGMIEISGITHRLQQGFSPGYGYTAIIVAWLGRLHPFAIMLVAFLFGALLVGGFGIQSSGVPSASVMVLQGLVLFFLLAGEIFINYRLEYRREEG